MRSNDPQMNREPVDTADEEELRDEQIEQEANVDVMGKRDTRVVGDMRDVPAKSRDTERYAPLFENKSADQFRNQWLEIQSRFVDDPSVSVKEADELVNQVIQNITHMFANERNSLETQWNSGDKVSTEELRMALKRYRSFFDRLLSLEA
jgi:hypothetical protein